MASNLAYGPQIVMDSLLLNIDGAVSATKELAKGRTITPNGISAANYTPSSAGATAKAFVFPSGGTAHPTIPFSSDWNIRGDISCDFIACKETDTGRQSIWAQIEDASPWEGLGLVSMSHDGNGKFAVWGGNYDVNSNYTWWDSTITLATNKWYYIAWTWAGTTQKVYARTIGDTSFTTDSTTSFGEHNGGTSDDTFDIGDNGTGGSASHILDGAIASLRIYTKILSEEEINQNFNAQRSRFGL